MHRATRGVRWASLALAVWLTACGGGGGSSDGPAEQSCSVLAQQDWLRQYMDDWYFWYADSPRPAAAGYPDVASYFEASLFRGKAPDFPADRWSRSESTESFNRFFGDGATLGYGVAVAGLEVIGQPFKPLMVRGVDTLSPAAAAGVQRGDEVLALNGRSTADLIAADDFSALTPSLAGDTLSLRLRRAGVERTVMLTAAVFSLAPVQGAEVKFSPLGRKLGYVAVKEMISQALGPLDRSFANFKASGVDDVVLDMRYNGGGLVSTGATLASYVAGARSSGRTYATLRYNDKRAAVNDQSFAFDSPAAALGLRRVIVLMGRRTCSASEQVINGLRGAGVEVLAVGETTCGKPVGFLPTSNCGQTYSVVNFESVNALNQGRYFDGFDPNCAVAEDFSVPQGAATDPLMAAAAHLADYGSCPATAGDGVRALGMTRGTRAGRAVEPGERQAMIPR